MRAVQSHREEQMVENARRYFQYAESYADRHKTEVDSPERAVFSAVMSLLWLKALELEQSRIEFVKDLPG